MIDCQFLSLEELTFALSGIGVNFSYRTVARRAADGTIPAFKIGRASIVNRDDLPAIAASLSASPRCIRA